MFTYHCKLNILIFCNEQAVKKAISDAKKVSDISFELFTNGDSFPDNADIVFFGIDKKPSELFKAYNGARLVLCAAGDEADKLDDVEMSYISGFWETPINGRIAAMRFEEILKQIRAQADAAMTLNCLNAAIDTVPDMMWFKTIDGIHTKVNNAFCGIVNKTREDVTGKDHCYIWDVSREEFDEGANACQESEEQVVKEKRTLNFLENVTGQRGMRKFKTYKSPVFGLDGSILGTVGIGQDITDIKNYDTKFDIVLNSMPYAVIIRDSKGDVTAVNTKFKEYFKVGLQEMANGDYSVWIAQNFEEQVKVKTNNCIEVKAKNSDLIYEVCNEPICDTFQNIVGSLSIYRDVTRLRSLEKKILRSSNTDFLTGLDNRRSFYNYIKTNNDVAQISILSIDIDHFKELNDTYGHKAGDVALVKVSDLFRSHFGNHFIARFGGDEFVAAITEKYTLDELKNMANSLRDKLRELVSGNEQMKGLTLSIGISSAENGSVDIDKLMAQSDKALYEAKESGRDCCCVYDE